MNAATTSEPTVLSWSRAARTFSIAPGLGFADGLNALARAAGRTDILLLADDISPEPTWLPGLATVAAADDIHAGAGPVWTPRGAAEPGSATPPVHPRASRLSPDFCLLRRSALDLVGDFEDRPTAQNSLDDWCARATNAGLCFVLADEILVPTPGPELADPLIAELGPLRRTTGRARRVTRATSVTIDARALGPRSGGTQSYTAALVLAVASTGEFDVRAVVAHDAPANSTTAFRDAGVNVITYETAVAGVAPTDLVHRPQQVFGAGDLNLSRLLSDRLVLTHLDLIAFHNPSYHASDAAWHEHRRMTRIGMAAADMVVFTSHHARSDALAEELITPERTAIAGIGVEQSGTAAAALRPAAVDPDTPFLLMLGADYAHKNRPFAIRLFSALREHHGFSGRLVLAGQHVDHGSTRVEEQALLAFDPGLAAAVTDLGSVTDGERNWLLAHTAALVCPSVYEGFGLTPLEAAGAGVPCLFAAVTALADVLDPEAATITPWDVRTSAARVDRLLRPGAARETHLARMQTALEAASWPLAAAQLGAAYEQALAGPYRSAAQIAWAQLAREQLIEDLGRHRKALEGVVGNALSLAGHGGLLSAEQQLGLIRIASRRWLAGPLLAPLELLGRIGRPQERSVRRGSLSVPSPTCRNTRRDGAPPQP